MTWFSKAISAVSDVAAEGVTLFGTSIGKPKLGDKLYSSSKAADLAKRNTGYVDSAAQSVVKVIFPRIYAVAKSVRNRIEGKPDATTTTAPPANYQQVVQQSALSLNTINPVYWIVGIIILIFIIVSWKR